jgi:amino acid transporter
MAFLEGTLGIGVGVLVGLALLKYSGYVEALKKELGYIASGAVFLILAAVLEPVATGIPSIATAVSWINIIFWVIAFILVLIGAISMAIQIFSKLK